MEPPTANDEEKTMEKLLTSLESDSLPSLMENLKSVLNSQLKFKKTLDRFYELVSSAPENRCQSLISDLFMYKHDALLGGIRKVLVKLVEEAYGLEEVVRDESSNQNKAYHGTGTALERCQGLCHHLKLLTDVFNTPLSESANKENAMDGSDYMFVRFFDKNAGDFNATCDMKHTYLPEMLTSLNTVKSQLEHLSFHLDEEPTQMFPYFPDHPVVKAQKLQADKHTVSSGVYHTLSPPNCFNEARLCHSTSWQSGAANITQSLMTVRQGHGTKSKDSPLLSEMQSPCRGCSQQIAQPLSYFGEMHPPSTGSRNSFGGCNELEDSAPVPQVYSNINPCQYGVHYAKNTWSSIIPKDKESKEKTQSVSLRICPESRKEVIAEPEKIRAKFKSPNQTPLCYSINFLRSLRYSPLSTTRPNNLPDLPVIIDGSKTFNELVLEVLNKFTTGAMNTEEVIQRLRLAQLYKYKELTDSLECVVSKVCLSDRNLSSICADICKLMAARLILPAQQEKMTKKEYKTRFAYLLMKTIINSFISILAYHSEQRERQRLIIILGNKTTLKSLQDLVRFSYHLFVLGVLVPGNIFDFGIVMLKSGHLYSIKCLLQLVGSLGPVLESYVCQSGKMQQKKELEDFYNHIKRVVSQNIAQGQIYQCLQKLLDDRCDAASEEPSVVSQGPGERTSDGRSPRSNEEWKYVGGLNNRKIKRLAENRRRNRKGGGPVERKPPQGRDVSLVAVQNYLRNKAIKSPRKKKNSSKYTSVHTPNACRSFHLLMESDGTENDIKSD